MKQCLRLWLLAGALGAAAGCLSAAAGCSRSQPAPTATERPCPADDAAVVDPPLLAFLSKARSLHHQADVAEAEQDAPRALAAIERIVAEPPGALKGRPEVEEVLSDAFARLAELRVGQGDFTRAATDIERGLGHAGEPSYFRGHLFEVRGLVEERHADALAREGKGDEARKARRLAIEASEEAVRIQDEVIRRAVGGKP